MTDNDIKCEKCFHQSVCEKKTCAECQSSYCDECELYDFYNGKPYVEDCEKFIDADFINRQKEEITKNENIIEAAENLIDTLKKEIESLIAGQKTLQKALNEKIEEVKRLQTYITNHPYRVVMGTADIYTETHEEYEKLIEKISTEAVKEFAERLKEFKIERETDEIIYAECIDNLVKEMVGE